MHQQSTLLSQALAEQDARHAAAIAAINARTGDLLEAQKLVEALSARGAKIRALVDFQPVGVHALCRITLWLTATSAEFAEITHWVLGADIVMDRLPLLDIGDIHMYELTLRHQKLRFNVALNDPKPASRFARLPTPAVA